MKRMMVLAAALSGLTLAGCEEPVSHQSEIAPSADEVVAPAAADEGVPAADTTAPTDVPPPTSTLPPEQRSSEQTVQPESETLFY